MQGKASPDPELILARFNGFQPDRDDVFTDRLVNSSFSIAWFLQERR